MSIHISSLLVWDHSSGLLLQVNVWVPWLYLGHWVSHNWAKIGSIELKNPASLILEKGRKFTTFTLDQNPAFLERARNPCPLGSICWDRQDDCGWEGPRISLCPSFPPVLRHRVPLSPVKSQGILPTLSTTEVELRFGFCHYGRNSYNVVVLLLILEAHKVCIREAEDLRKE